MKWLPANLERGGIDPLFGNPEDIRCYWCLADKISLLTEIFKRSPLTPPSSSLLVSMLLISGLRV
jgi:hypothetical protein